MIHRIRHIAQTMGMPLLLGVLGFLIGFAFVMALRANSEWRAECEAAGGTVVSETEYVWLPVYNPATKMTDLRYTPQTTWECVK